MQFKRSVGTVGLLFAAVGGVVGSGWLFGPYYAAKFAGPASVLAWLLGGTLMMFVALTFAELAAAFPVVGGSARFLDFSHGHLVGFTFGWIVWLSSIAVAPIETLALIQYAASYLPGLMHKVGGAAELTTKGFEVAFIVMLLMSYINAKGAETLSKTNNIIVFLKLLIPIVTLALLFSLSFHPQNFISHGFAPMGFKQVLDALPAAGIIFSFVGYSPAIQLAGEARNPQRAIPIAIIGALLICIVLYSLLEVAFIGAVPAQSLQHGWAHLTFAGDMGPFVGLVSALGLVWFVKVLYLDAFISPFGTALLYTGSTARMGYAMVENKHFPGFLRALNKHGVPWRVIALNFMVGLLLFLPFPSWQNMVDFLVSALVFAYAVGPIALIVLRKTRAEQHRPFRLPCHNLMAFVAFYICNLIVYWAGWHMIYKMLIAIALGYVLFSVSRFFARRQVPALDFKHALWVFAYLILTGVCSFLGSFGGGDNYITFGWDFIMILAMSVIIFVWARSSAKDY